MSWSSQTTCNTNKAVLVQVRITKVLWMLILLLSYRCVARPVIYQYLYFTQAVVLQSPVVTMFVMFPSIPSQSPYIKQPPGQASSKAPVE